MLKIKPRAQYAIRTRMQHLYNNSRKQKVNSQTSLLLTGHRECSTGAHFYSGASCEKDVPGDTLLFGNNILSDGCYQTNDKD